MAQSPEERLIKRKETCKRYYESHKEQAKEATRKWQGKNKHKLRKYKANWREKNPNYDAERIKEWRLSHPEENKKRMHLSYIKRVSFPKWRLANAMRVSVWQSLIKGTKQGRRWERLVGYTCEELKNHLERHFKIGMSWDNYGEWHIDHKIPISVFNFEKPEDTDFTRCWELKNLQPLWASDNVRKHNKLYKPFQPSLNIAERSFYNG